MISEKSVDFDESIEINYNLNQPRILSFKYIVLIELEASASQTKTSVMCEWRIGYLGNVMGLIEVNEYLQL